MAGHRGGGRTVEPGLCGSCAHARLVRSARGSTFWLCGGARRDARLRKYPPLPVLRCHAWESGTPRIGRSGSDDGPGPPGRAGEREPAPP